MVVIFSGKLEWKLKHFSCQRRMKIIVDEVTWDLRWKWHEFCENLNYDSALVNVCGCLNTFDVDLWLFNHILWWFEGVWRYFMLVLSCLWMFEYIWCWFEVVWTNFMMIWSCFWIFEVVFMLAWGCLTLILWMFEIASCWLYVCLKLFKVIKNIQDVDKNILDLLVIVWSYYIWNLNHVWIIWKSHICLQGKMLECFNFYKSVSNPHTIETHTKIPTIPSNKY